MEYLVTNKFLEEVLDPETLSKHLIGGDQVFRELHQLQELTDDVSQTTISGGHGPQKIIARFPESVMIEILRLEPDFLRDRKQFDRVLEKYPIYRAYTKRGSVGQATNIYQRPKR